MALAKTKISSPLEVRVGQTRAEITQQYRDSGSQAANTANRIFALPRIVESGGSVDTATTNDPSWATAVDAFTSPTSYANSLQYITKIASQVQAGDILELEGRYVVEIGATTVLNLRVVVQDGASIIVLPGTFFGGNAASYTNETGIVIPIFSRYVMTSQMGAGACAIAVQGKRPSGSGAAILLNTSGFKYRLLRSSQQ